MTIRSLYIPVVALLVGLSLACQKPASPNKAPSDQGSATAAGGPVASDPIQEAVFTYLTKVRGLDLSKMTIAVTNQKVDGDKATCEAAFTVKGMADMPPMEYTYDLQKEGGAWKVTASKGKDGGHAGGPPAGGDMPAGHPPMGGEAPAMSPGHPGMGGSAATPGQGGGAAGMPAGHPDVSDIAQPKPADAKPKSK